MTTANSAVIDVPCTHKKFVDAFVRAASMAVTTTLPLFWHLSSSVKEERLDSSAKLISVLEDFQERFRASPSKPVNGVSTEADHSDSDIDNDEDGAPNVMDVSKELDTDNAADVAYAIRRLMRGLASPRESSRLGFAVALTEVSTISIIALGTISYDILAYKAYRYCQLRPDARAPQNHVADLEQHVQAGGTRRTLCQALWNQVHHSIRTHRISKAAQVLLERCKVAEII